MDVLGQLMAFFRPSGTSGNDEDGGGGVSLDESEEFFIESGTEINNKIVTVLCSKLRAYGQNVSKFLVG
jgi:hypothetical protein